MVHGYLSTCRWIPGLTDLEGERCIPAEALAPRSLLFAGKELSLSTSRASESGTRPCRKASYIVWYEITGYHSLCLYSMEHVARSRWEDTESTLGACKNKRYQLRSSPVSVIDGVQDVQDVLDAAANIKVVPSRVVAICRQPLIMRAKS